MTYGSMPGAGYPLRPVPGSVGRTVSRQRRSTESSLLVILVTAAVGIIFLYQDLMNVVDDDLRLTMAGAMAALLLFLSVTMIPFRMTSRLVFMCAALVGLVLFWCIAIAIGQSEFDLKLMVYAVLPLAFAPWIIEYRNAIHPRALAAFVLATIAFAGIWSARSPFVQQGLVLRVVPFSGTLDQGSHPSSYYLAICVVMLHILMVRGDVQRKLGWPAIAVAICVMLALRVATPVLTLIYYSGTFILLNRRASISIRVALLVFAIIGIAAVLQMHSLWVGDPGIADMPIEELGSGRVGTWIGRIQMIMDRDLALNLFGGGPGSDLFYSPMWWWRKMYSHSDLLTTVIEDGFLGLICVFSVFAAIFLRFGRATAPLFVFFAAGSLTDGALMGRPVLFLLYWVAFAMVVADRPLPKRRDARRMTRLTPAQVRRASVVAGGLASLPPSGAIAAERHGDGTARLPDQ